eukprot:m.120140 g.120140  ORF g.120140 m.120140 type:complete len:201 (-) comp13683_c0_seq27:133-735(-)
MAACIHSFLTSTELQLHLENHFTEAKPQPRAKRVDSRLPLDLEQYEILVEESLPRDVVAVWQRELSQHALDTQVLPMNAEEASEVNMRQGIVIATASSQHCPPQICVQWDREEIQEWIPRPQGIVEVGDVFKQPIPKQRSQQTLKKRGSFKRRHVRDKGTGKGQTTEDYTLTNPSLLGLAYIPQDNPRHTLIDADDGNDV